MGSGRYAYIVHILCGISYLIIKTRKKEKTKNQSFETKFIHGSERNLFTGDLSPRPIYETSKSLHQ